MDTVPDKPLQDMRAIQDTIIKSFGLPPSVLPTHTTSAGEGSVYRFKDTPNWRARAME